MRYGSVCSGIEAATVAWAPLGWRAQFFAEIDRAPSAVLAHHYGSNMPGEPPARNGVPNHGDFTQIGESAGPIDLLVGGTPCQSFSVAGKRLGLDDPRGNLAIEFCRLALRLRPRWVVWENVPGVLSSSGGRGFGAFLGLLGECGYGVAYRVLDAQYVRVDGFARAVPQRRERVFVVGYLGDWRRAAAVLFEPEGMRGDSAPRREAGQRIAPALAARTTGGGGLGTDHDLNGGLIAFGGNNTAGHVEVATACNGHGGPHGRLDFESETFVVAGHGDYRREGLPCLRAGGADAQGGSELLVAHALRADGFDASEDGTGRGTPIVAFPLQYGNAQGGKAQGGVGIRDAGAPAYTLDSQGPVHGVAIAFSCKDSGADATAGAAPTMRAMGHDGSHANAGGQLAVAFDMRGREGGSQFEGPHETANIRAASGGSSRSYVAEPGEVYPALSANEGGTLTQIPPLAVSVGASWAVRRLTPTECERLQGFPDGFTHVPYRKGLMADGPRYKCLGNSMAVNCMRWIGLRIQLVEALGLAEAA